MTACKERHGVRIGLQTLIAFTCCAGDNFHVKDGDQKLFGWRGAKGSLVLVLRRIGATLLSPTRMILFYAGGQSHTQLTNRHTQKHIHARARARTRTHHTHTHARTHAQHKHTHKLHTHTNTCTHLLCPHNGHQTERPAAADCGEYGQAHIVWYSVDHHPLGHRLIHLKHTNVDNPIIMTGTVQ